MTPLNSSLGGESGGGSRSEPSPPKAYKLGPFVLQSEFPIPELPLAELGEIANVSVRYGTVPEEIENAGTREADLEVSPREVLLKIEGVARILLRDGREVVIQAEPKALAADLRSYLLAAAFGVLCHQSGMLPLHASSIQLGTGVVAFLGDSGAGKSTLAAFLARRGHTVVSDDICLLDPCAGTQVGGPPLVVPVAPWMKLWRNTVEQLGRSAEELPRVFSDNDKYRLNMGSTGERRPLKQLLVLEWQDEITPSMAGAREGSGAGIEIERLDTLHAIQSMLEFTYQSYLIEGMGRTREYFQLCGRALSGVEAFRFRRPKGFEQIEEVLDALEAHFTQSGNRGSVPVNSNPE